MRTQAELERDYRRGGRLNPYLGRLVQTGAISLDEAETLPRDHGMEAYCAMLKWRRAKWAKAAK